MGFADKIKELVLGTYSYQNKKGVQWYLHSKTVARYETQDGESESKIYYFSKDSKDAISLPEGYTVVESEKTGMPTLRKRRT